MIRTLVTPKVVLTQKGLRLIVSLAIFAILLSVAVLAMLLGILYDMAPHTGIDRGKEYEAIRIAVELLALAGTGGFTVWNLAYRHVTER